jgi:hypothetical protein
MLKTRKLLEVDATLSSAVRAEIGASSEHEVIENQELPAHAALFPKREAPEQTRKPSAARTKLDSTARLSSRWMSPDLGDAVRRVSGAAPSADVRLMPIVPPTESIVERLISAARERGEPVAVVPQLVAMPGEVVVQSRRALEEAIAFNDRLHLSRPRAEREQIAREITERALRYRLGLGLPFAVVAHPSGAINFQFKAGEETEDGLSRLLTEYPDVIASYAPLQLLDRAAAFDRSGLLLLGHYDVLEPNGMGITAVHEADHLRRFFGAFRGVASPFHGEMMALDGSSLPRCMANLHSEHQALDEPPAYLGTLKDMLIRYLDRLKANPALEPSELSLITIQGLETSARNVIAADRAVKALKREDAALDYGVAPELYPDLPSAFLSLSGPQGAQYQLVVPILGDQPTSLPELVTRAREQLSWTLEASREVYWVFRLAAMVQERIEAVPPDDLDGRRALGEALLEVIRSVEVETDPDRRAPRFGDVVQRFNRALVAD